MDVTAIWILFGALAAGLITVSYLIATDKSRFLARFELNQWRETYYMRALPNFLQSLYNRHFASPFPARRNWLSTLIYRFRIRPHLRMRGTTLRRAFLQQHIILFALLEKLRPYLRDFFLNEQQRLVGERIVAMEDTIERDRLIAYLDAIRQERALFYASLTSHDRATLVTMAERNTIAKLRIAHAIYQEHGYSLVPEFTQLRRWEELSGVELVQELPTGSRHRTRERTREIA
jgi:hypothetical protein